MRYTLLIYADILFCTVSFSGIHAQANLAQSLKYKVKSSNIDTTKSIDMDRPAFVVTRAGKIKNNSISEDISNDSMIYHTTISRFIDASNTFVHQDSTRITVINQSLANLYMFALGQMRWEFLSPARVVVDIKDSGRYYRFTSYLNGKGYLKGSEWWKWARENAFCYELQVPASFYDKRYEIMTSDLNRYFGSLFGVQGEMGKRKIRCLALVRTSREDKIATKGKSDNYESNRFHFSTHNGNLSDLIYALNQNLPLKDLMLVDATGYTGKTDIELNCDLSNMTAVNRELKRYALKLKEGENDIDMIIIKEKK